MPPGARAEIANCGSSPSSGSGSFLSITELEDILLKKIMVAEKVLLLQFSQVKKGNFQGIL
jgi:hypothetical protein